MVFCHPQIAGFVCRAKALKIWSCCRTSPSWRHQTTEHGTSNCMIPGKGLYYILNIHVSELCTIWFVHMKRKVFCTWRFSKRFWSCFFTLSILCKFVAGTSNSSWRRHCRFSDLAFSKSTNPTTDRLSSGWIHIIFSHFSLVSRGNVRIQTKSHRGALFETKWMWPGAVAGIRNLLQRRLAIGCFATNSWLSCFGVGIYSNLIGICWLI